MVQIRDRAKQSKTNMRLTEFKMSSSALIVSRMDQIGNEYEGKACVRCFAVEGGEARLKQCYAVAHSLSLHTQEGQ